MNANCQDFLRNFAQQDNTVMGQHVRRAFMPRRSPFLESALRPRSRNRTARNRIEEHAHCVTSHLEILLGGTLEEPRLLPWSIRFVGQSETMAFKPQLVSADDLDTLFAEIDDLLEGE